MFLDASEIATRIARQDLQVMGDAERGGAGFAKGEVERQVGQRVGGGDVTRDKRADASQNHQIDQLREVAAFLGQCRGALGGVDRFRRGVAPRDP